MKNLPLEPSIATYFAASNARDPIAFADCFAPDAVVLDEGQELQGIEALREWLRRTTEEYDFRMEPLEAWSGSDRQIIKAHVTGTFPGSPIDLFYVFDLRDGQIVRLETTDRHPDAG